MEDLLCEEAEEFPAVEILPQEVQIQSVASSFAEKPSIRRGFDEKNYKQGKDGDEVYVDEQNCNPG